MFFNILTFPFWEFKLTSLQGNIYNICIRGNFMQLLGIPLVETFKKSHADARGALDSWQKEVSDASWKNPQDIKDRYKTASILANNVVIFNIKGNKYRLVVKVRYANNIVLIQWIGTHAQYNAKTF